MSRKAPKRPRDPNQLAKLVVDIATQEVSQDTFAQAERAKDPSAVALGRRGGLKGGVARAEALSSSERREIASKAARSRWRSKGDKPD